MRVRQLVSGVSLLGFLVCAALRFGYWDWGVAFLGRGGGMRGLAAAEDPNSAGPPPTLLRCKRYCTRHARLCTGKDVCYGPRDTGRCMRSCMTLDGGGRAGGIAGGARNSGPGAGNLHCMSFFLDVVERSRVQEGVCDYACDGGGMCDASVAHECGAYCDQMAAGPGNHDCCPEKKQEHHNARSERRRLLAGTVFRRQRPHVSSRDQRS